MGEELPVPLEVLVTDANGRPVRGTTVQWRVTEGGGTITPDSTTTDVTGKATARWTVGTAAGPQAATATAPNLPAARFIATGTPAAPESLTLRTPSDTLVAGQPVQLTTEVKDRFSNLTTAAITWTSSDTTVAAVGADGSVQGKLVGDAFIAAEIPGLRDSVRVTVTPGHATTVRITPDSTTIVAGTAQVLEGIATDAFGNAIPDRRHWSSSDTLVARIDSTGRVVGGRAALARITLRVDSVTATVPVQVVPGPLAAIVRLESGTPEAPVGSLLAPLPRLAIEDVAGNRLPDVAVSLNAGSGGQVAPAIVTTDTAGTFGPTSWRLGTAAGQQLLTARVTGGPETTVPAIGFALTSISAGGTFTCGISTERIAYCWGDNGQGQLGIGSTADQSLPTRVAGDIVWLEIDAAEFHACGRDVNNDAYCWGNLPGASWSNVPQLVPSGHKVTDIAASNSASCLVTVSGAGYCWGQNGYGQLGDGTLQVRATPTLVQGGHQFRHLEIGRRQACGITVGGETYCWGDNTFGQLGDGSNSPSRFPVKVATSEVFTELSLQEIDSCGLTASGAAWCWGGAPQQVAPTLQFQTLSAFWGHRCGVTLDGTAYCWGSNSNGQLGNGTTTATNTPTPVAGTQRFTDISAGGGFPVGAAMSGGHTCAIATTGAAYCWGWNSNGQLGNGTPFDATTPTPYGRQ